MSKYKRKDEIKALLYDYVANRKRIAEIERAVIEGTPERVVAVRTGPGDPTSARAIRLAMDEEIEELTAKVKVVETLMAHIAQLPTEQRHQDAQLIRMLYTDRLSLAQAAARLGVEPRWLKDRNARIVRILEGIVIAYNKS